MDGIPDQDLGSDFHFESDSVALQSILNNGGLTPRLKPRLNPALTPASNLPNRYRKFENRFDFFEGKNGTVFYRPSAKFGPPSAGKSGGKAGSSAAAGGTNSDAFRGFQRGLNLGPPKRLVPRAKKTPATNAKRPPRLPCQTEKRFVPLAGSRSTMRDPAVVRMSISERRPLAVNIKRRSYLPRPMAQKALDFDDGDRGKENAGPRPLEEDPFEFAKPLAPSPQQPPPGSLKSQQLKGRSMAELILMRESLGGCHLLPRESFSSLLRQSLSKTELDRMFEDDSTESFENLEKRLRTPKRKAGQVASSRREEVSAPKFQVEEETQVKAMARVAGDGDATHESQVQGVEPDDDEEEDDDDDDDEGEHGVTVLHRTASMVDLREEEAEGNKDGMAEQVSKTEDGEGVLARTMSAVDLREATEEADLVRGALDARQEYQRQQDMIDQEILRLLEKSRKRREEFKLSWGVSPRSVNCKRTVKTMIVCPEKVDLSCQEQEGEQGVSEVNEEEEEEKRRQIDRIARELERAGLEHEAAASSQCVDAPAAAVCQGEDPFMTADDGSRAPSLGEIVPTAGGVGDEQHALTPDSRNIDWFGELFGADARLDLGAAQEEDEGEGWQLEEGRDEDDEEDEVDEDDEVVEMEMTQVVAPSEMEEELSEAEQKQEESRPPANEDLLPQSDGGAPVVAAADNVTARDKAKRQKRKSVVRFVDPDTPGQDGGFLQQTEEEEEETRVKITVPLHVGGRSADICFTERRRSACSVRLHQPTPGEGGGRARRRSRQLRRRTAPAFRPAEEDESETAAAVANTPAALRIISRRAQEELASLYRDEDGDTEEEGSGVKTRMSFED